MIVQELDGTHLFVRRSESSEYGVHIDYKYVSREKAEEVAERQIELMESFEVCFKEGRDCQYKRFIDMCDKCKDLSRKARM